MGTHADCGLRIADWKRRRGQSTLEYLLIVGVVLAAILALINSTIKPKVESTVTDAGGAIGKASDEFKSKLGL